MGTFVSVTVSADRCLSGCRQCVELCPVDIFVVKDEKVEIAQENEDECTLCYLCSEGCPGKWVEILKHY